MSVSAPAEPAEQLLRVGRARLSYWACGAAPRALLWLHGGFDSKRTWLELWSSFEALGWSMVAVDLRGHGGSTCDDRDYAVGAMARDVAALVEALGLEGVLICGHSLGGMVAQELAISHPRRVLGLVLLDTTFNTTITPWDAAQTLAARLAFKLMSIAQVIEATAKELSVYRPDVAAHIRREMAPFGRDRARYEAIWKGVLAFDRADAVSCIGVPVLVIAAANNPTTSRQALLLGQRLPFARVELLKGCGHMLHWDKPREIAGLIEFFARALW